MSWTDPLPALSPQARQMLAALPQRRVPQGTPLFRAGDTAQGFAVVLLGRVEVFLTGPSGREILLYAVEPGQSCIQSTLGLMADEPYSGEAVTAVDSDLVFIPRASFLRLMDEEAGFRGFVLQAFARRMADVTRLLERVAFGRIEARLAQALLDLAEGGVVQATQAELAARIGSAREVISRRLDAFARAGWVATDRGHVALRDPAALRQLAATLV
ncbi:MAG: Crp/Fnr family transcriptional regulator [Rhodobacteraceae bacterium]|nr:Crp/Fnr family transcriptional regulator [Paracoccaceae bacterium]